MSITVDQINLLKELLKIEKSRNKSLYEQLEIEKESVQKERAFHKIEINKYKRIAEEITKEYIQHIEQNSTYMSESDSDSDIDLDSFFD
jgi:hypothetical protein